jgi:class 3 adenylate cyclase
VDTSAWEQAGIYDPASPKAAERRALLEYLSARGATLEQMVEAAKIGAMPGVAGTLVRGSDPHVTVEELAADSGVSPELVRRVLLAAGLQVEEGGRVPRYLEALISAFVQGVALMGESPILAFTRVIGAAATNVAEAAVALFYTELGPGSGREGRDELARAIIAERANLAFSVVPEAVSLVLRAQFDRASLRGVLVREWGDDALAPESEVVALGFVDLVGSTAWAAALDLRDQSLALSRFESVAWSSAVGKGGRVVKMIGDEAFFAAPSVDAACAIATQIVAAVHDDPVLPPARGAVGRGLATARVGDYFGPVVNLISRLVKVAAPGTVVLSGDALGELSSDQFTARPLGPQAVRGLDAPVEAYEVTAAAHA